MSDKHSIGGEWQVVASANWGLNNYLETKQITRFSGEQPWGWYIK